MRNKGPVTWRVPKEIQQNTSGMKGIRPFRVPLINFDARHISELSDLAICETEAPVTSNLDESQLRAFAFKPLNLRGLPCHTTACECGVQITTSSAMVASKTDLRDGASFNKIAARRRNEDAEMKLWNINKK